MKTEIRNEFILEAHKSACSEWKLKIEKECPGLFEKKLEVGKWYVNTKFGKMLFCFSGKFGNDSKSYGLDFDGNFSNNLGVHLSEIYQYALATEEEVKEALIKEAKKRGFKNGVMLKKEGINEKAHSAGFPINGFIFRPEENGLDSLNCCGWIFKGGKWAIISNPIEEKIKKYERKIEELKKQL